MTKRINEKLHDVVAIMLGISLIAMLPLVVFLTGEAAYGALFVR